jgi:uncharacterized protein
MQSDEFEWDDAKAEENYRKHGVTFDEAAYALSDPMCLEEPDERFDYGEERYFAVAMGAKLLLAIVYTVRGEACRVISAREATRHEQRNYYSQSAS